MSNGIKVVEPAEAYAKHIGLRATSLKVLVEESPLHYHDRYILGNRPKETDSLRFGRIAHAALLEPDVFRERMVEKPKFEGKGAFTRRDEWKASLPPDAMILDGDEIVDLIGLMETIAKREDIRKILEKGVAELSLYWDDDVTGLPCKARPDYVTEDGWVVNFKTARDASLRGFTKQIGDLRYDMQAAMYCEGYRQVFGKDPAGYIFIPAETQRPWPISVFTADPTVLEIGARDIRRAIDIYANCLKTGVWTGYQFDPKTGEATGPQNISVPYWMMVEDK